jgi:hypothetical protein
MRAQRRTPLRSIILISGHLSNPGLNLHLIIVPAEGCRSVFLQYSQIALMAISSYYSFTFAVIIRREFACATSAWLIVLLSSLEQLYSWFIAERPPWDPAAVCATILAQR